MIKQAAILCGGLGTRLGKFTRDVPKPLLSVGGRPFLEVLIGELSRHGFTDIVLLSSFQSERMQSFAAEAAQHSRRPIKIKVAIEPGQAGTGGALWHARNLLDETILLLNGDSWFDFPLLDLANLLERNSDAVGALGLRPMEASSRYGEVRLSGTQITTFRAHGPDTGHMLVNGGIYAFRRAFFDYLTPNCSLERDALPSAAEDGRLLGLVGGGPFIDIGVPEDFMRAQVEVSRRLMKPALFLDRDGVLNLDHGHIGSIDRFDWVPGAREAVKIANLAGYYVFLVTNQAGIAKGLYTEQDYSALMHHVELELAAKGAHLDDVRYCPFHPDATVERYRKASRWRKPGPGMLEDLLQSWPVDVSRSLLIGDKESDLQAAEQVGIAGHLFQGGNLLTFIQPILANGLEDVQK